MLVLSVNRLNFGLLSGGVFICFLRLNMVKLSCWCCVRVLVLICGNCWLFVVRICLCVVVRVVWLVVRLWLFVSVWLISVLSVGDLKFFYYLCGVFLLRWVWVVLLLV